jgi:phosphatidylinositol-3-phosphatase
MRRAWTVLFLFAAVIGLVPLSRGSGNSQSSTLDIGMPQFEHVFVLVEENENYGDVVGNIEDMPYMNSLIRDYGLATNYYADSHPSVNNYFFLTAGRPGFSNFWASDGALADLHWGLVSGENVASVLTDNKKTWKAYLEGLPRPGSLTAKRDGYVKRHDPFAYFTTVLRGTQKYQPQTSNLVPFEGNFERDLQQRTFPNYSFIVPDVYDDGHDDRKTGKAAGCGDHAVMKQVDQWLNKNIKNLVEAPDFQRSGLLIIVFDEACDRGSKADRRFNPRQPSIRGGGHVPALIISSKVKAGTTSDRLLHHESLLRLSLRALGIQQFPGAAASAPDMDEFFMKP